MRYLSYTIAVLALGLVATYFLFWLPKNTAHKELPIDQLLLELQNEKRFITTDQLAERMISQDPSLVLIDVRAELDYKTFSLPGAINIPLGEILDPEYDHYFEEGELEIVFFAKDNFLSEQAWMIKKRQDKHRIFILDGGLDQWEKDILSPVAPAETASKDEFDRYAFRKAALQYFNGESKAFDPSMFADNTDASPKKKIKLVPNLSSKNLEGC